MSDAWDIEQANARHFKSVMDMLNETEEREMTDDEVHGALRSLMSVAIQQQITIKELSYDLRSREAKKPFFKKLFGR